MLSNPARKRLGLCSLASRSYISDVVPDVTSILFTVLYHNTDSQPFLHFRCPAGVPVIEVWSHHFAPSRTSLVEGGWENWLQAWSPCLQVSAGSSTVVSCWRTWRAADFEARCRLRSASLSSLVIRRTRLSTVGDRAFPVAAARVWNSLPQHVTSVQSLPVFCSCLYFRRCFPRPCCCAWEVTSSFSDTLIVSLTYLLISHLRLGSYFSFDFCLHRFLTRARNLLNCLPWYIRSPVVADKLRVAFCWYWKRLSTV